MEPRGPHSTEEALIQIARELPVLRSDVRLTRRSHRFTIAVVVVAVLTGGWLFWDDHRDERLLCERSNETRETIADAVEAQVDALIAASAPADGVETPQRAASVRDYRSRIDPKVDELRGDREC